MIASRCRPVAKSGARHALVSFILRHPHQHLKCQFPFETSSSFDLSGSHPSSHPTAPAPTQLLELSVARRTTARPCIVRHGCRHEYVQY